VAWLSLQLLALVAPLDVSEQLVCWIEEMVVAYHQTGLHHPILLYRYHSPLGYYDPRAHPIHLLNPVVGIPLYDIVYIISYCNEWP